MMTHSIDEKMNRIKAKIVSLGFQVEGCTEDEIEQLRQEQGVDFLPELYRQLMLLMGKEGLSRLLDGAASCSSLSKKRKGFESALKQCNVSSMKDFFVFMEHAGYQYFFFRTKDGSNDPVVWGQWEYSHFYKLGDSLSTFILEELEPDWEVRNNRMGQRMTTAYFYNPEEDDFYSGPHPDPPDC